MKIHKVPHFISFTLVALSLVACAQKPRRQMIPELDGASQAPGAAYTGDSMHFRKAMPLREDWRPLKFYFKHCSEVGEESFYSKTSYECSSAY